MSAIKMFYSVLILLLTLEKCTGIIYELNDTEYVRMPPLFGLDEYASCLVPQNGTYCVARFDLRAEQPDGLMVMIQEYSDYDIKHFNHTYIERGICVTKTCTNFIKSYQNVTDLGHILEVCLNASVWSEYGLQTKLAQVYYCDRHGEKRTIDTSDWLVAGVFMTVLIANLVGSCYDVYIRRTIKKDVMNSENKFLLSFSIFRNCKRLVAKEPKELKTKKLGSFNGIRVLLIFLIPLPHLMGINGMPFIDNPHDFEQSTDNPFYQLIFNGLVIVQVFFVMSGFLLVYNLQTYAEEHKVTWGLALRTWVLRWFRLTPAYAALIAFTSTWIRFVGSGPIWNLLITNAVVEGCKKSWWMHLLYFQNYAAGQNACALHTWHMGAEMQLFCVGLVVYLVTRSRGRNVVLGSLLAIGILLPAFNIWQLDLDALTMIRPEFTRMFINDTFFFMHLYGHNHLASYILGMGAGYLVYALQKRNVDFSNNKIFIQLSWCTIPMIVCLYFTGSVFYADRERAPLAVRMVYAVIYRFLTAVPVAFLFVVLAMGINHPLRRIFEWSMWVVPSRLTYCTYLIHFHLIYISIALKSQLTIVSTYYLIIFHFGVLGLAFLLAVPLYLMIEAPFKWMIAALVSPNKYK